MPTDKRRILFNNEASFHSSGYGTYGKAVLNYLYDTNKYELAELATYGLVNDPKDRDIKWKYYANWVLENDPRYKEYKSAPQNEFGAWRFERVLLDFKPDIVFSIRDPYDYVMMWEGESPLRRFFNYVIMPTVDSIPQKYKWIDYFIKADAVLTYSDWGQAVLAEQGDGLINLQGVASPGVDIDVFLPLDKKAHRKKMGFDEDIFVIGTVMRNQKRKLFPDLMISFKNFLSTVDKSIADKSYLYLHTSYPELTGWDIPALILEHGLSNKVILTYNCPECKYAFSSYFQDARTLCPNCHKLSATLPSVMNGVSTENLCNIYNLFDVYVQNANCEGFGVPMVEAAACGIPIMVTDYSAMSEIAKKTHGYHIRPLKLAREIETGADRSVADNNHLTELLVKFFTQPEHMRIRRSEQARQGVLNNYTWKHTAEAWERYFDFVQLKDEQGKWDAKARFINPNRSIPDNLGNNDFVNWCMTNILQRPELLDTYSVLELVRELNYQNPMLNAKIRNRIIQNCMTKVEKYNNVEYARVHPETLDFPDYIQYANIRHG